ncbi:hypothetical protein M1D51_12495 [Arthrobacter sp. R3-55]
MLTWWRDDLSLPPYLSEELMPVGGFTETVELEAVPPHFAMARLKEIAAEVRNAAVVTA